MDGGRPRGGLLRHRDFRLLWIGETTSKVGSSVSTLAIPLVAFATLDASAFEVSVLTAMTWLPWLLVGLPAGPRCSPRGSRRTIRRPCMRASWAGARHLLGGVDHGGGDARVFGAVAERAEAEGGCAQRDAPDTSPLQPQGPRFLRSADRVFDETGTVSPLRAEAYLTAALTHTDSTEIAQAYGYSSRPGQPAAYCAGHCPLPGPETRLVVVMLTLRTAHTGTGNLVGQDLTGLGLSDPRGVVEQLADCGWLSLPASVESLLESRPENPTPVTIPSLLPDGEGRAPVRSGLAGRRARSSAAGPRKPSPTRTSARRRRPPAPACSP